MPKKGTYIACGKADNESGTPCILYRSDLSNTWDLVHESSVITSCFTDVHGTDEGDFIVAVGGRRKSVAHTPNNGCLSYYSDEVGAWTEYAVPANYVLVSVYVPESGLAFVGGYNLVTGNGYVWRWTPTRGFVQSLETTPTGAFNLPFEHIHGSSADDIWACQNGDVAATNSRMLFHFSSGSWDSGIVISGGEGGFGNRMFVQAVSATEAYCNALDGQYVYGGAWRGKTGIWDGSNWAFTTYPVNSSNNRPMGIAAASGYALGCGYQTDGVLQPRIYKIVGTSVSIRWGTYESSTDERFVADIALDPDGLNAICVGYDTAPGHSNRGHFVESADAGDNWQGGSGTISTKINLLDNDGNPYYFASGVFRSEHQAPDLGVYVAASGLVYGVDSWGVVLFRAVGSSVWREVHRSSVASGSGSGTGFGGISGLPNGSFIVAVGQGVYKSSFAPPVAGCLSWYDVNVGHWQDYPVPANYRLFDVHVSAAGGARVSGYDVTEPNTAKMWAWNPINGFTEIDSVYHYAGTVTFHHITESVSTLVFPGNSVYNPGLLQFKDEGPDPWVRGEYYNSIPPYQDTIRQCSTSPYVYECDFLCIASHHAGIQPSNVLFWALQTSPYSGTTWTRLTAYVPGDKVYWNGNYYICLQSHTADILVTDEAWWVARRCCFVAGGFGLGTSYWLDTWNPLTSYVLQEAASELRTTILPAQSVSGSQIPYGIAKGIENPGTPSASPFFLGVAWAEGNYKIMKGSESGNPVYKKAHWIKPGRIAIAPHDGYKSAIVVGTHDGYAKYIDSGDQGEHWGDYHFFQRYKYDWAADVFYASIVGPVITPVSPQDGDTGVYKTQAVTVDITDSDSDLDLLASKIYINNVLVWESDSPVIGSGFTGGRYPISNGSRYTLNGTLSAGLNEVDAIALNVLGLSITESWSFSVTATPDISGGEYDPDAGYNEIDFPVRFDQNCDIIKTTWDVARNRVINLTAFVRKHGIPIVPLGIGVDKFVFEPIDEVFKSFISVVVRDGLHLGVDQITVLDSEIYFEEDGNNLKVIVPYLDRKTGERKTSIVSIPRQLLDK